MPHESSWHAVSAERSVLWWPLADARWVIEIRVCDHVTFLSYHDFDK